MSDMNPADCKLAAITLFEAFWNRDQEARDAMINGCEPIELVTGLVGVVAAMAGQVAYMQGGEISQVIEAHRASYLIEQATT